MTDQELNQRASDRASARERHVAVITGASSGIGAEFARQLAERGFDLILVARREEKLLEVAAELTDEHSGVQCETLPLDLASDQGRTALAERLRTMPDLSLLVNNAGFGTMGMFWEAPIEGQMEMHRLHVLATVELSHAALGNLVPKNRPGSGIISVSSVASYGQSPSNVSYCATKTWMSAFTEGLAIELAVRQSAVTVQALCPGFTYSEFHDRLGMDRGPIPKQLWMSSEFVVSDSLKAFDRRALFVVPGWRYKILVGLMKIAPKSWLRAIYAKLAVRFRKKRLPVGQI
jgi:short-subunit dehydrogenase